jgi:hypothetical protein
MFNVTCYSDAKRRERVRSKREFDLLIGFGEKNRSFRREKLSTMEGDAVLSMKRGEPERTETRVKEG